jgi:hypothetical protein
MRGGASFVKIGALFFAAVMFTAISSSKSVYAQSHIARNFGQPGGPTHGRAGLAQRRGLESFGHGGGSFRGWGFHGRFGQRPRDFGTNIVVAPTVVAPAAPYYGAPYEYDGVGLPPYESLRCFLHRHVETPNGPALQPVYVC